MRSSLTSSGLSSSGHLFLHSPAISPWVVGGCDWVGCADGVGWVWGCWLKEMAERLPVGAARNSNSPSFGSSSPPITQDVSTAATDMLNGHMTCHELDSKGSSSLVISNGSSTISNHTSSHSEVVHPEATARSKTRTAKGEPTNGDEWVEQDEPGVYITLVSLPGGAKDLKRVRFSQAQELHDMPYVLHLVGKKHRAFDGAEKSLGEVIRKRFSEKEAEQWWALNRARVYQQYNIPMVDKASVGMGREGLAH
ncbi:protein brevis radix-like 4 [Quercus suber]|uniref:Protein brevis radix-like 4 n=1 Tax=Quercus suber TaxID=58331 RepID=A0AAW0J534_QUESU